METRAMIMYGIAVVICIIIFYMVVYGGTKKVVSTGKQFDGAAVKSVVVYVKDMESCAHCEITRSLVDRAYMSLLTRLGDDLPVKSVHSRNIDFFIEEGKQMVPDGKVPVIVFNLYDGRLHKYTGSLISEVDLDKFAEDLLKLYPKAK